MIVEIAAVATAVISAALYIRVLAVNRRLRARLEAVAWERHRAGEELGPPAWLESLR